MESAPQSLVGRLYKNLTASDSGSISNVSRAVLVALALSSVSCKKVQDRNVQNVITNSAGKPVDSKEACSLEVSDAYPASFQIVVPGVDNVNFGCWKVKLAEACYNDTLQFLQMQHIGDRPSHITHLRLYEPHYFKSNFREINGGSGTVTFKNLSLDIVRGSSHTLCVSGNVAPGAKPGELHTFQINNASAISTEGSAPIQGTFPIQLMKTEVVE